MTSDENDYSVDFVWQCPLLDSRLLHHHLQATFCSNVLALINRNTYVFESNE